MAVGEAVRRWRTLLLVGVIAVTATASWLAWALLRPGPARSVSVEVAPGTASSRVLEELERRQLIPSAIAARLYLAVAARGRSLCFGSYLIPAHARPYETLEQMLEGRVNTLRVTIVEGLSVAEVAGVMAAAGIGSETEWLNLAADPTWIHDLAPDATSLEGFLFPDTYQLAHGLDAATAARHLVDRFHEVWEAETAQVPRLWSSALEAVTLASLVEAETSLPEERARIAGVFHNRLRLGMLLQCDPTVAYALKRHELWTGRLLRTHWEIDDPYNTYRYPGLPPGPINNPGRAALAAALQPAATEELYFVAKPGGGHSFSSNLRDHNRAVQRLRNSRR